MAQEHCLQNFLSFKYPLPICYLVTAYVNEGVAHHQLQEVTPQRYPLFFIFRPKVGVASDPFVTWTWRGGVFLLIQF